MSANPVTERDFRKPEFLDAKPEDYERRPDGAIVRKDRWETAIREIADIVGLGESCSGFEIVDVVKLVRDKWAGTQAAHDWQPWHGQGEWPADKERPAMVRLRNGTEIDGEMVATFDWSNRSVLAIWQVTHFWGLPL